MNNGPKKLRTLELERPGRETLSELKQRISEHPSTLLDKGKELTQGEADKVFDAKVSKEDMLKGIVKDFNMKPQKLIESQQDILHAAQTVSECIAPLTIIATRTGLKLSKPRDYKYAVQILRNQK